MRYTKTESKTSPLITVELNDGESIKTEPGAMVFHNGKVSLEGKMNGGFGKALMKKMFTNESFFITTATGTENGGKIGIAPKGFGDIHEIKVGPSQWLLNDGAYLASDATVDYTTKSQGIGKAMFGKTGGLFVIQTSGEGSMLINSFGSLMEFELDGDQSIVIDNGHVVCWEDTLTYKMEVASGTFGFTTGEGLVCRFSGKGKVILQTRNIENFAGILSSFMVQ
ncbi:uncharacterized protein (TIGR00266 family) [Bacilli bacterium PM5-3]|nr:uncharacterized protein (TIGR00266 family) [Bacilli bacterium PM5-3]MDH6603619.1 uncharacterized protein (TIGR00266 family) [Bacilli bacterium PM5-9]